MLNKLKIAFFNSENKVRNGWWILIFIALIALTRPIYKPIKNILSDIGVGASHLEWLPVALILLVTYICLRLRKEKLKDVGLRFNRSFLRHLVMGTIAGAIMVCSVVSLIYIGGGVDFSLNAEFAWSMLPIALYAFLIGATMEELLHRGFLFQRLIGGIGFWPAQLIVASIFAIGHWSNPGMEGVGKVIGSADLFVGSILLGIAYYKTQSLALPIGLHLGWNWCMGAIFGVNVSGHERAGILEPELLNAPLWLNGGEFGFEASILSVFVGLVACVVLYKWKVKTVDSAAEFELMSAQSKS